MIFCRVKSDVFFSWLLIILAESSTVL